MSDKELNVGDRFRDDFYTYEIYEDYDGKLSLIYSYSKKEVGNSIFSDSDIIFTKISQPVTFKEALESCKKVKLDESVLKTIDIKCNCDEEIIREYVAELKNGKYLNMTSILLVIGWNIYPNELQYIFNEKCWYIE